jgi:hypothetical protein
LRKTSEVRSSLFPSGESTFGDQELGDCEEFPVIISNVVARHIRRFLSSFDESSKLVMSVAACVVKGRIPLANRELELVEGRVASHARQELPRVPGISGIPNSPTDDFSIGQPTALSKRGNVPEELFES